MAEAFVRHKAILGDGRMMMVMGVVDSAKSLVTFLTPDAIDSGHTVLLEVFIGIAALALLAQAVAVIAVAVVAYKAQKRGMEIVEEVRERTIPIIMKSHFLLEKSQTLIAELTPKIQTITANVEHISTVVKDKVVELEPTVSAANVTVKDANEKTHQQIVRVNGMITSALNATSEISNTIYEGIRTPAREIAGVISGAKATLDSLLSKTKGFGAGIKPGARYASRPAAANGRAGYAETGAQAKAAAASFQRAEKSDLDL